MHLTISQFSLFFLNGSLFTGHAISHSFINLVGVWAVSQSSPTVADYPLAFATNHRLDKLLPRPTGISSRAIGSIQLARVKHDIYFTNLKL